MGRGDLSDKECVRLEPHLPKNAGRGGRWKSHRRVINGILLRQRTGIPWRTCRSNSASGRPFTTGIDAGQRMARGTGFCGLSRLMLTRGPHRLIHGERGLHGVPRPPARRRSRRSTPRIPGRRRRPVSHRVDEALGRSRGGFTCKIHLASEGGQRPRALVITPGQWGDAPQLIEVLDRIRVARPAGGHPRTCPDYLSGDRSYSSRRDRRYLRRRQIKHTIPETQEPAGQPSKPGQQGRSAHRL